MNFDRLPDIYNERPQPRAPGWRSWRYTHFESGSRRLRLGKIVFFFSPEPCDCWTHGPHRVWTQMFHIHIQTWPEG